MLSENQKEYISFNYKHKSDTEIADFLSVRKNSIYSYRKKMGLVKYGCCVRNYTIDEDKFIKENFIKKTDEELAKALGRSTSSIVARRFKIGAKRLTQRINGFPKGNVPWNKGKKGLIMKGSEKTQFKKGNIPAQAYKEGKEITREEKGRKVIYIKAGRKLQPKHRWIWEQINGPIPKGYLIRFKNGNTLDCRIENLECITFAENCSRNNKTREKKPKVLRHKKGFIYAVLQGIVD